MSKSPLDPIEKARRRRAIERRRKQRREERKKIREMKTTGADDLLLRPLDKDRKTE